MFQTKAVEKIKTHFVFSNLFFFENRFVYEIMWKNIVQPERPRMIWPMCIACWIPKATNTHSEYVILIGFSRQHWLRETPQCYVIRTLSCFCSQPDDSYIQGGPKVDIQ